ncbi:hypothetical protein MX054_000602 [Enterobacter cloacae]|nr:hypothetical protein [Enterobacter cloacae]
MSTFTKEQLRESAREKVMGLEYALKHPGAFAETLTELEEELELARIALASLESEPAGVVRHIELRGPEHPAGIHASLYSRLDDGIELYTAPPAQVVPDMAAFGEMPFLGTQEKAFVSGWNACRAAMLQGAEPVTTANKLPDDFDFGRFNDVTWLECIASNPQMHSPTTSTIAMVALELNKRLETGNSQVVPDGYCIMPLKLTADNGAKGALCGEFHVQYRIVCQSCVGEGCEDCNHTGGWDAEIPVSWDTIKRIHEAAVEACTLPAAPQQEVKP